MEIKINDHVKVVDSSPSRIWVKIDSWNQIKNAFGTIKEIRNKIGERTTFLVIPDAERTEERTNTGMDGWWLTEDEFVKC